jgi:hypothetical protein
LTRLKRSVQFLLITASVMVGMVVIWTMVLRPLFGFLVRRFVSDMP